MQPTLVAMDKVDEKSYLNGARLVALTIGFLTLNLMGCSMTMHDEAVGNAQPNDSEPRTIEFIGPPPVPPSVFASRGAGTGMTEGKLFVADWDDVAPGASKRPPEAIEWPDPINRSLGTLFKMTVDIEPYWIHTMVYEAIDPVRGIPINLETGEPTETPTYEHQCRRAEGEQPCPKPQDGVVQIDSLPDVPGPSEFVMLFAAWDVPPTEDERAQGIQNWSRRASATWMFHFVNK